jgi:dolichol-phosphate mannosyltransferase
LKPQLSIVIPVYNEGEAIVECLDRVFDAVTIPCEVLAVYDFEEDSTVPFLEKYLVHEERLRPTLNTYGRGPANAIKFGLDHAVGDVTIVSMADGSDDAYQMDTLARIVQRGPVIVAASRYMKGGAQIGGPFIKKTMSRLAGLSLYWLARVNTHDATSSFKAYSTEFVRSVGVEAVAGFEVALELVAKARRLRLPVAEVPTIWLDRTQGESNFKVAAWLPHYLKWYRFAFGPRLTLEELKKRGRPS